MNSNPQTKTVKTSIDIIKYLPKEYSKKAEEIIKRKFEKSEIQKIYSIRYVYQMKSILEGVIKNPDKYPKPAINLEVVEILRELAQDNYDKLEELGLL